MKYSKKRIKIFYSLFYLLILAFAFPLFFASCENMIEPLSENSLYDTSDENDSKKDFLNPEEASFGSYIVFNIKEGEKIPEVTSAKRAVYRTFVNKTSVNRSSANRSSANRSSANRSSANRSSANRTVSSSITSSLFSYITFEGSHSDGSQLLFSAENFSELSGKKIYVKQGVWTFSLTAYIGREESGGIVSVEGEKYTATKSLTVQAGQNTLSMELKVDTSSSSSSHTGSWSYEVTFPSSNIDKVTLRLLSQTNSGFNTSPSYEDSRIKGIDYSLSGYQTVTFEGDSCLAGYYIVYVSYEVLTSQKANEENKNYAIVSGWGEVMCINPGVHTSGSIRLSEINPVYSITLNTNGGEWDTSSLTSIPITYTKESGEVDSNGINTGNITLPATDAFSSRPGYYFDGWYNNSSFSGSAISSFNVSDKENKTFYAKWKQTTVYVSPFGKDDDASYDGSSSKPFKTLSKALSYIQGENQSNADWLVYVSGTVYGSASISQSPSPIFPASSLTISGISSDYTSGVLDARDSSNGTSATPILTVGENSSFPVKLKNLTLQKGGNGALTVGSLSTLYLENCNITQNTGDVVISYNAQSNIYLTDVLINENYKSDGTSPSYALKNLNNSASDNVTFAGATKISAENKVYMNASSSSYVIASELSASKPVMVIETSKTVGAQILTSEDSSVLSKASRKIILSDTTKEILSDGKLAEKTSHDLYISASGSDTFGDGSEETPYNSLSKALSSLSDKYALDSNNKPINNIYVLSDYEVTRGIGVDFDVYANIIGEKMGNEGSAITFKVNTSDSSCLYLQNNQKLYFENINITSDFTYSTPNEYCVFFVNSGTEVHLENVNINGIVGKSTSAIHIDGDCYLKNTSITNCLSVSDIWGYAINVKSGKLHIGENVIVKGNTSVKNDGSLLSSDGNIWIGHKDESVEYYNPIIVEENLKNSELYVTPYTIFGTSTPVVITSGYSTYNTKTPSEIFKNSLGYQVGEVTLTSPGGGTEAAMNKPFLMTWGEDYDFTTTFKAGDTLSFELNFTDGFGNALTGVSLYCTATLSSDCSRSIGTAASPISVSESSYTLEIPGGTSSFSLVAKKTIAEKEWIQTVENQSLNHQFTKLYVSSSGDDDGGLGCKELPFATLQKAVDTIATYNDSSTTYTICVGGTISGETVISKNLSGEHPAFNASSLYIEGPDPENPEASILDGANSSRVLNIDLDIPITLKNLCIQNCTSALDGGAIYKSGTSTLAISDSLIKNNSSSAKGGAIYIESPSALTVGYSSFLNNRANDTFSAGGAIYSDGSSVTISSSTITGNTSTLGGAVYIAAKTFGSTKQGVNLNLLGSTKFPSASYGVNDIFLEDKCAIQIGYNLSEENYVATITPEVYSEESSVLTSLIPTYLAGNYYKFQVTPQVLPSGDSYDWFVDSSGKLAKCGEVASISVDIGGDILVTSSENAGGTVILTASEGFTNYTWNASPEISNSSLSGNGRIFTFNKSLLASSFSYSILLTAQKNGIPYSSYVTISAE